MSLTVKPTEQVSGVRLFNDLPASVIEGGFMVELGDFHGDETGRVMLEIDVPALAEQGLAQVCELELRWVEISTMESRLATIPIHVNVVPGDDAAGRIADAEVTTELAFQRAQHAKREADEALRRGDTDAAKRAYRGAHEALGEQLASAPAAMAGDISEEMVMLENLATDAEHDAICARKRSMADRNMKSRRRRG